MDTERNRDVVAGVWLLAMSFVFAVTAPNGEPHAMFHLVCMLAALAAGGALLAKAIDRPRK